MSSSELTSWRRYFQVEPHNSIEVQIAYLSMMAGSFMGVKDKKLDDYLITSWVKKEEENTQKITPSQMLGAWGLS